MMNAELQPVTSSSESAKRAPKYFNNLDSLRFLAFLGVFLCHNVAVPNTVPQDTFIGRSLHSLFYNGARGVEMFFVISGFIITYLLIQEKTKTGTIALKNFYVRRALRIWPLFYLIVAYVFLIKPALLHWYGIHLQYSFSPSYLNNHPSPLLWATFLGNFDIVLGNGAPPDSELHLLWSLCVEEQFYLVMPALLKYLKLAQIPYALLVGVVAGIAFRVYFTYDHVAFASNFDTLVLLDFFAMGGLLAYIVAVRETKLREFLNGKVNATAEWVFLLIVLYLLAYDTYDNRGLFETALKYTFYAGAFVVLILSFEFKSNTLAWLKGNGVLTYLGKISYGLYMFHMVVWTILYLHMKKSYSGWTIAFVTMTTTIAVAGLSHRFFESPFLKLSKRFRSLT